METLCLWLSACSTGPAVVARDPFIAALLGFNAMAWLLIGKCLA